MLFRFKVLTALAAVLSVAAAQATIVVPTNSVTIQNAISMAAPFEDIIVLPGLYQEEQIIVDKPVQIYGPNVGIPIDGDRGPEAHLTGAFRIISNSVKIQGFEMTGGYLDNAAIRRVVFSTMSLDNIDVSYNVIHSLNFGVLTIPIHIGSPIDGLRSHNIRFSHNSIFSGGEGVDWGFSCTAADNVEISFNGSIMASDSIGPGIKLDACNNSLITANQMFIDISAAPYPEPNGIVVSTFFGPSDGVQITNNGLYGTNTGILANNEGSPLSNLSILNNLIEAPQSTGIQCNKVNGLQVVSNSIDLTSAPGMFQAGAVIDGCTLASVAKNLVAFRVEEPTGLHYGIQLSAFGADLNGVSVVDNEVLKAQYGLIFETDVNVIRSIDVVRNVIEGTEAGLQLQSRNTSGPNVVAYDTMAINQNHIRGGTYCVNIFGNTVVPRQVANVALRRNCFEPYPGYSNVAGVKVWSYPVIPTNGGVIDARMNYWNASNGPGPVGAGSGLGVSTRVDFSKWLKSCPH